MIYLGEPLSASNRAAAASSVTRCSPGSHRERRQPGVRGTSRHRAAPVAVRHDPSRRRRVHRAPEHTLDHEVAGNDAQCAELAALLARRAAARTVAFGGDVNRRRSCAPDGAWTRTDRPPSRPRGSSTSTEAARCARPRRRCSRPRTPTTTSCWSARTSPQSDESPSRSADVREHVDDRAAGIFDEEAANAPRLVGERVDDLQSPPYDLGVRGIDGRGVTDVDTEARLRPCISWAPTMTSAGGSRAIGGPGPGPPWRPASRERRRISPETR